MMPKDAACSILTKLTYGAPSRLAFCISSKLRLTRCSRSHTFLWSLKSTWRQTNGSDDSSLVKSGIRPGRSGTKFKPFAMANIAKMKKKERIC
uniref:Uncharacterized protein n=1 Tax=Romanomermis culicivorax TaxID=13658 RepID=A0A915KUC2_ROMCU